MYVIKVSEHLYPTPEEMKIYMVTQDYAMARATFDQIKRDRKYNFSYLFLGKNETTTT
jgi:hypothetical protein